MYYICSQCQVVYMIHLQKRFLHFSAALQQNLQWQHIIIISHQYTKPLWDLWANNKLSLESRGVLSWRRSPAAGCHVPQTCKTAGQGKHTSHRNLRNNNYVYSRDFSQVSTQRLWDYVS